MRKNYCIFILLYIALIPLGAQSYIRIETDATDLVLKIADNKRVYQSYFGEKLSDISELSTVTRTTDNKLWEAYPVSGGEDFFEPAFAIQHNDGNLTSFVYYVRHEVKQHDANVTETVIELADDVYPLNIQLHYMSYAKENIIKTWSEIIHKEKKPVNISRYASGILYFQSNQYFLTEFSGNWGQEAQMSTQKLSFGKRTIDSKLGTRAAIHGNPFFQVGLDQPASLNQGEVLMGTIGWTGNFQFIFEVDNKGNLRVISGINPYASNYELKPDEKFITPEFIFTYSNTGTGEATRSFHDWARNYQIKDGKGDRMTLLNNWEATFFDFDEKKLEELMKDASFLGVDMFLLDAGWFGNKYPQIDDTQGLGDWEVMHDRLPRGIPHLVKTAGENGLKFGIWIEPEMVNPKSELFEKHPDWAILQPNRTPYYERNQLALDMSNPKVQDFVFGVVDNLMKENPDLAYFKWDCNSPITNIYSPYLKDKQNQLYVNHTLGVYSVLKRVKEKYPHLPMMLCASGGGRCDFEALKYFTEFWCSDNTDPVARLYIQWGFSQFIPVKAMAAHVTEQNHQASIKFRADVAMMCKFGFDIDLNKLTSTEKQFCKQAVQTYNKLKKTILDGDMYHLVSPFESNHTAVMFVNENKNKAYLYVYDIFPKREDKVVLVKLQGLISGKKYKVEEINLMPDGQSDLKSNNKIFSGDYLMKVGLEAFSTKRMSSRIIEITEL